MQVIREKLALVPQRSGVYLMRDAQGGIIYIGKAKNLRSRLGSYFKSGSHDAKVTSMLGHIVDFDYFITRTENDALALEANMIKKHRPHYNILLKDNKSFPYIRIVDGEFPYLEVTRKTRHFANKQGDKLFGPYFNGIWARELLDTIKDIFQLRSCGMPQFRKKQPCLNHQINRCSAPCAGRISKEDYAKTIDDVRAFLRGEREFGARELIQHKMEKAAELEQFELAIKYRNSLGFLDRLKERTITEVAHDLNCDIFGYATHGEIFVVSVLTVRAGKLIGAQNFTNENKGIEDTDEMLGGFIMQYYTENPVPEQIVADMPLDQVSAVLGCQIFNPKAATKKKLLDMARANAAEYLDTSIERIKFKREFTVGACQELGRVLGMTSVPRRIECFDISHMGGEEQVASMVVFIDGTHERKYYRRFKIRHHEGNNDFLSMQEVIKRRINRIGTSDPGFGPRPDLVIVDGGKGQLSAAIEILKQTNTDLVVISLAKGHEEIFIPNNPTPIILSKRSYALRLIQRIRDEAHRFAVTYHKLLRSKKSPLMKT